MQGVYVQGRGGVKSVWSVYGTKTWMPVPSGESTVRGDPLTPLLAIRPARQKTYVDLVLLWTMCSTCAVLLIVEHCEWYLSVMF